MRPVAALVLLGMTSMALSAQTAPDFKVSLLQGGTERAAVWAHGTEPYQNGPWASVQALPLKDATAPTATSFRVRSWKEDSKARVVVFAVTGDESASPGQRMTPPTGGRETQIATFLLEDGASKDVTETAKYQAASITIRAARVAPVNK
jgi:hypothetical protein